MVDHLPDPGRQGMTRDGQPPSAEGGATAPDFVAVDVETACHRIGSICQIGIVGFRDGRVAFEYETLVDPRDDFSPFNVRVHGITSDHVADAPRFGDVHPLVHGHLAGRITVAHSFFDRSALAAAASEHGVAHLEATWLDSVGVARRAWPELPSHRLNALTRLLGIRHRHHDALSDARAAGMIVVRAIEHTGIELAGWLAPARTRGVKPPQPAPAGPLRGERVAILGAARNGSLATLLTAAGARVMASVGATTTTLVISAEQPFGRFVAAHADHRRAEELRQRGAAIRIVGEAEIPASLAALPD